MAPGVPCISRRRISCRLGARPGGLSRCATLGRRNAAAGFAWAITLVNMRFPIIMETLLKYHGEEFLKDDAFANGVMSSLIMLYDITPDDSVLAAYRQHRTAASDARVAELWAAAGAAPAPGKTKTT